MLGIHAAFPQFRLQLSPPPPSRSANKGWEGVLNAWFLRRDSLRQFSALPVRRNLLLPLFSWLSGVANDASCVVTLLFIYLFPCCCGTVVGLGCDPCKWRPQWKSIKVIHAVLAGGRTRNNASKWKSIRQVVGALCQWALSAVDDAQS